MSEWVIVAVVGVILLFSAKKLPDMARGLGQSMRIFKAETRGMREDDAQHGDRPAAPGSTASGPTEPPAVAPGRAAGDPAPGGTAGSGTSGSPTTAEPRGGSTPS